MKSLWAFEILLFIVADDTYGDTFVNTTNIEENPESFDHSTSDKPYDKPEGFKIPTEGTKEEEFCIFPSYGQWVSKKMQGIKVQIGIHCPEGTIDNGDHVIVPKGVTCHFGCGDANGKKIGRVGFSGWLSRRTTLDDLLIVTCNQPLSKQQLIKYGCYNGQCDTDLIANGPNRLNWPNNEFPYTLRQLGSDNSDFDYIFTKVDNMKCFPIVDSCDPAQLRSNEDDETDVSWDCPNGHGHGAVCTKTCNDGTLAGSKSKKNMPM